MFNTTEYDNTDEVCLKDMFKTVLPKYRHVFEFEKNFPYMEKSLYLRENWTLGFYYVAIYLTLIVVGRRVMQTRKAFDLRRELFIWNCGLSLLSIVASIRVIPEMVYIIREFGFVYSVCDMGASQHGDAVGLWAWLFAWSKLWELGDTAFIVLRKQKLIFLHWYHHISVLLGVWFGCGYVNSMGRWFMAVNYFVHAFMYSYYALKSKKVKIPKAVSMAITFAQIMQMVTCIYVTYTVYRVKGLGEKCCVPYQTLSIGVFLYISYFLLFLNYFLRAYVLTATPKSTKTLKKVD